MLNARSRYSTISNQSPFKASSLSSNNSSDYLINDEESSFNNGVSRTVNGSSNSSSINNSNSSISAISGSRKPSYWWYTIIILTTICTIILIIQQLDINILYDTTTKTDIKAVSTSGDGKFGLRKKTTNVAKANPRVMACDWKEGDAHAYYIKTKMGVNYGSGHWFHMAENLMVQHSILRDQHRLSNASTLFLDFDDKGCEQACSKKMNGVTRFMVALGLMEVAAAPPPTAAELDAIADSVNSRTRRNRRRRRAGSSFEVSTAASASASSDTSTRSEPPPPPPPTYFRKIHYVSLSPPSSLVSLHQGDTILIKASDTNLGFDMNAPTEQRFLPPSQSSAASAATTSTGTENVCVKMMGSVGGAWPTPQRGHWFPNAGDVDTFRSKIESLCPRDAAKMAMYEKKKPHKAVIYQRDISRKLSNQDEAIALMRSGGFAEELWEIQVLMHAPDRAPCDLAHALSNVDLLLTPHGFQSMLLLFLPRPAVLFEVFPYRYYKRGYGPLSAEYGVIHGGVMSPPLTWHHQALLSLISTSTCMSSKWCRGYARSSDVQLTQRGVSQLVGLISEHRASLGYTLAIDGYSHSNRNSNIGNSSSNDSSSVISSKVFTPSPSRDFLYQ